jgi:hypothetical protein
MGAKAAKAIRTAWPVAGIGLAVAVNGVWIAALGYGISKFFWSPVLMKGAFQRILSLAAAGVLVRT